MANKEQSTIKDVARVSGVSIGTVDRVLHNRGRVSEINKKTVLKAVKDLSYHPSQIARALASRRSTIKIGITYPKVDNEFWSEIVEGIACAENKLRPFGVELIVDYTNTYDVKDQVHAIDRLLTQGVNGLLITAVDDSSGERIERHIPVDIPYATAINATYGTRRAFHIGPNDFALGGLAAKLTQLYCGEGCNVIILAPNIDINGMQQRIAGFVSKIKQDLTGMNILRTCSIPGGTEEEIHNNLYNLTIDNMKRLSKVNAIYIPTGMFEWAAAAVKDSDGTGKIKVFGHEYTSSLPQYLNDNIVAATIYQHPAQQWHAAINLFYDILAGNRIIENPEIPVECSIIIKETLPLIKIGGLDLF